MHNWAKEIMECVKSKIKGKGIENIEMPELEEFKCWTEVAKNITEYDYYYHITEAMEKPENQYGVTYDENGKYYTQPRDSMGRYMSRGYEHDPNMMMYRDMDSHMGRMYYTDSYNMGNSNSNANNRMYSESRYDRAKRGYEEAKEMNPNIDNSKAMESIFHALEEDMEKLMPKMTATEKNTARNKLSNMANMMM